MSNWCVKCGRHEEWGCTCPSTPCPKRLTHDLYDDDCNVVWVPRGRRSLSEIFELVYDGKFKYAVLPVGESDIFQ